MWDLYRLHCSGGYHGPMKLEGREFFKDEKSYKDLCGSFLSYGIGLNEHLKVSLVGILFPCVLVAVVLSVMIFVRMRYMHFRNEKIFLRTLPLPKSAISEVMNFRRSFEDMLKPRAIGKICIDAVRQLLLKRASGQFSALSMWNSAIHHSAFRHTASMQQSQNNLLAQACRNGCILNFPWRSQFLSATVIHSASKRHFTSHHEPGSGCTWRLSLS